MDAAEEFAVPGKFAPKGQQHVYQYTKGLDLTPKKKGQTKTLQPKPSVSAFLVQQPRMQFYQAPVCAFEKWFKDYQFASLLKDNGVTSKYEYRFIFLNPSSSNDEGHDSVAPFLKLVVHFYQSVFSFKLNEIGRAHV